MNWRGRPLESHEVIVKHHPPRPPTPAPWLTVHAELEHRQLPQGHQDHRPADGAASNKRALRRHDFHGEWNYALVPQRAHGPP